MCGQGVENTLARDPHTPSFGNHEIIILKATSFLDGHKSYT
jgi:hypothetical protein